MADLIESLKPDEWLSPETICDHPELHSTPLKIVILLVCIDDGETSPRRGWYSAGCEEFFAEHCSGYRVYAWRPIPPKPELRPKKGSA